MEGHGKDLKRFENLSSVFFYPLIEKPQISIYSGSQRTCRLAAQLCQTSTVQFYGDKSHVTTPPHSLVKVLPQPSRVDLQIITEHRNTHEHVYRSHTVRLSFLEILPYRKKLKVSDKSNS